MKKRFMNTKVSVLLMLMLGLSAVLCSATSSAAPSYLVKDLGDLGGGGVGGDYEDPGSIGLDISISGQVVGYSAVPIGDERWHAFLYDGTMMQDLAYLAEQQDPKYHLLGLCSYAIGINNSGMVVGWRSTRDVYYTRNTCAFLYNGAIFSLIGSFSTLDCIVENSDGTYVRVPSEAHDINNSGQVVGWAQTGDDGYGYNHAFLYSNGTMHDIGALVGGLSEAYGINDAGQIVGQSQTSTCQNQFGDPCWHAFLFSGNAMHDIGTLGGHNSIARRINEPGKKYSSRVVGYSEVSPGDQRYHAFLYDGTTMHDLGTLGGNYSEAYDINNSDQVVGYASLTNALHAFLYYKGTMYDLNDLIPVSSGWVLLGARGINDAGQITGRGAINGALHAYLLTPGAYVATSDTPVQVSIGIQITLTFSNIVSAGSVTAGMVPEGLPAPANFDIVGDSEYNIILDPSFSFGTVAICIGYDPVKITVPEVGLQLIHHNGISWETSLVPMPVDTVNKRVCGVFSSLSPVAVAEPRTFFYGFFSPVDNLPVVNSAKAGQAIPVKWRITDANGVPVSDPASFKNLTSFQINCGSFSGEPASPVEEYAAGSSGLQYSGDGYWQFNWKTPKTYAGQCRKMILTLGDVGHEADFKFK